MTRTGLILSAIAGGLLFAPAAIALNLQLPANARLTLETIADPDSYALPTGVLAQGVIPVEVLEGHIRRQAWQIDIVGQSTLQILAPLREQLEADGFDILLNCQAAGCGGFDFRFETEVIDAPDMHVDLFDFRFISARRGHGDTAEFVSLLISKSSTAGFVQVIRVAPSGEQPNAEPLVTATAAAITHVPTVVQTGPALSLGKALEKNGHLVLSDLAFETGSSKLGPQEFPSLATLAAYLRANPERKVALVGHTDSQGSLAANIALSKRRAAAVVERLARAHGVPRAQITGEGMGYLAPRATNLSDAGREANRRVEVILLSTR